MLAAGRGTQGVCSGSFWYGYICAPAGRTQRRWQGCPGVGIGALRLLLPLPGFQLLCGDCHMTVICVTQVCHCKVEELTLPEPDGRVDVLVSTELYISWACCYAPRGPMHATRHSPEPAALPCPYIPPLHLLSLLLCRTQEQQ